MTTTTHETQITVDDEVPQVRIVREFDATPAEVFRAHADPELFARWVGPRYLQTTIDRYDCRTGGSYRFVQTDGDDEYAFFGSFHEVREGELIVQTFGFEGMPDAVSLDRVVLQDIGEGRTRLTATSQLDSFEALREFVASGMEQGVREGYEQLDELLAD